MFARLLDFRNDRRGTATIELALIAPILATMVIGIIDISTVVGRKLSIEQAAQRSIEKVMQTTGETTAEETIIAEAAEQGEVPPENVTVAYKLECDATPVADYNTKCSNGQVESRYIEVKVVDSYTPMFPVQYAGLGDDGKFHISATAGMRTQ